MIAFGQQFPLWGILLRITWLIGATACFCSFNTHSAPTIGENSVLFLNIRFAGDAKPLITAEEAKNLIEQSSRHLKGYSYGKFWMKPSICEISLPQPMTFYNESTMEGAANEAAFALGKSPANFNITCYYADLYQVSHASYGRIHLNWTNIPTAVHEIGHALGLAHANSVRFAQGDFLGAGTDEEYGNVYDMMGGAAHYLQPEDPKEVPEAHFNAFTKNWLGWLPEKAIASITANGIYALAPIDTTLVDGAIHALRIKRSATENFWVELRQSAPSPFAGNGVFVLLSDAFGPGNQLIDTTPDSNPVWKINGRGGSDSGKFDAPLTAGRSIEDPHSHVLIMPLGWREGRFDVYVRVAGNEAPPTPYYAGRFTWARPEFFPSFGPPQFFLGYTAYFSPIPGVRFRVEQSTDLSDWRDLGNSSADGTITAFTVDLFSFSMSWEPRYFRAVPLDP